MNYLGMSNLDGSGRRNFLQNVLRHPFGVVVHENTVYWAEWDTTSIRKWNKVAPTQATTLTTSPQKKATQLLVRTTEI